MKIILVLLMVSAGRAWLSSLAQDLSHGSSQMGSEAGTEEGDVEDLESMQAPLSLPLISGLLHAVSLWGLVWTFSHCSPLGHRTPHAATKGSSTSMLVNNVAAVWPFMTCPEKTPSISPTVLQWWK